MPQPKQILDRSGSIRATTQAKHMTLSYKYPIARLKQSIPQPRQILDRSGSIRATTQAKHMTRPYNYSITQAQSVPQPRQYPFLQIFDGAGVRDARNGFALLIRQRRQ